MISLVLYYSGLFFILLSWLTNKIFGYVTIDQVWFTLKYSFDGTLSPVYYRLYIYLCLCFPVALIAVLKLIENKIKVQFFNITLKTYLCYIVLVIGLVNVYKEFAIMDFILQFSKGRSDYFKLNYINPKSVAFKANNSKNLILIYVESLESTYSDTSLFSHDLLHGIHQIKGISFQNYIQMPGTGWTIAAMVATQCGIPLKGMTMFNQFGFNLFKEFLGNAECLSDILARHGYVNVFMNGPDLNFADVGGFLRTHHYTEMYGKKEWLARGVKKEGMSTWGMNDDDLFEHAKEKLTILMQNHQHFNLTLLTIDSHGYAGFLSKTCKRRGYHDFEGIIECTADQVADFVNFVREKGWQDQINIVILGDHLAMKNQVYEKLMLSKNRSIFNLFISDQAILKNTNTVTHFDMFPTILEFIGFQFEGRLGLGYSAISATRPFEARNRVSVMKREIRRYSDTYNELWK